MPKPKSKPRPKTSAASRHNAESSSDDDGGAQPTGASLPPQIPGNVIRKLLAFSFLLLVLPILAYFASLRYLFVGSTASSAIVAVIVANCVLAAYVYAAWIEDGAAQHTATKRKLKVR